MLLSSCRLSYNAGRGWRAVMYCMVVLGPPLRALLSLPILSSELGDLEPARTPPPYLNAPGLATPSSGRPGRGPPAPHMSGLWVDGHQTPQAQCLSHSCCLVVGSAWDSPLTSSLRLGGNQVFCRKMHSCLPMAGSDFAEGGSDSMPMSL